MLHCKKTLSDGTFKNCLKYYPTDNIIQDHSNQNKIQLHRSVSSLKNQMDKERSIHRQEYLRKMRENAFLLQEIEELKRELKKATEYKIPPKLSRHSSSLVDR
jgi:hypothetical protein